MRPHDGPQRRSASGSPLVSQRGGALRAFGLLLCGLWASVFIQQAGQRCCFSLAVFVLPAGARTPAHSPDRLFASQTLSDGRKQKGGGALNEENII